MCYLFSIKTFAQEGESVRLVRLGPLLIRDQNDFILCYLFSQYPVPLNEVFVPCYTLPKDSQPWGVAPVSESFIFHISGPIFEGCRIVPHCMASHSPTSAESRDRGGSTDG